MRKGLSPRWILVVLALSLGIFIGRWSERTRPIDGVFACSFARIPGQTYQVDAYELSRTTRLVTVHTGGRTLMLNRADLDVCLLVKDSNGVYGNE